MLLLFDEISKPLLSFDELEDVFEEEELDDVDRDEGDDLITNCCILFSY